MICCNWICEAFIFTPVIDNLKLKARWNIGRFIKISKDGGKKINGFLYCFCGPATALLRFNTTTSHLYTNFYKAHDNFYLAL